MNQLFGLQHRRDRFEVNPESWTQLKGSLQTCPFDCILVKYPVLFCRLTNMNRATALTDCRSHQH